jgi:CCR4-NOT transcription complex subunit 2
MSDEGLMAVFYTMPRDLAQEMSAQELYVLCCVATGFERRRLTAYQHRHNREWRWHVRYRIWLQKDPSFAAPTRIDAKQERGFYIIFNVGQWRKERVS